MVDVKNTISADSRRRLRGLSMLDEGMITSEVAGQLGVHPSTVRRWRAAAQKEHTEQTIPAQTLVQRSVDDHDGVSVDAILAKLRAINESRSVGSITVEEAQLALIIARANNELSLSRSRNIRADIDAGLMVDRDATWRLVAQLIARQERYGLMNRQLWHELVEAKTVGQVKDICERRQEQLNDVLGSLVRVFEATEGPLNVKKGTP